MSELIDNRARKIATLKEIIQHLHQGKAPEGKVPIAGDGAADQSLRDHGYGTRADIWRHASRRSKVYV